MAEPVPSHDLLPALETVTFHRRLFTAATTALGAGVTDAYGPALHDPDIHAYFLGAVHVGPSFFLRLFVDGSAGVARYAIGHHCQELFTGEV